MPEFGAWVSTFVDSRALGLLVPKFRIISELWNSAKTEVLAVEFLPLVDEIGPELVVLVHVFGVLWIETPDADADLRRVRANQDIGIVLICNERVEELLGLVCGDAAVDLEGQRVLTILEAVLLDKHGLAIDDVVDTSVAPHLHATSVDECVKDAIEELVGPCGFQVADDVPAVHVGVAFRVVVAEREKPVRVFGVVPDACRILTRHTTRTHQQAGICDEHIADAFGVFVEVDWKLGEGHFVIFL